MRILTVLITCFLLFGTALAHPNSHRARKALFVGGIVGATTFAIMTVTNPKESVSFIVSRNQVKAGLLQWSFK